MMDPASSKVHKVELLAPAGSADAFEAAIANGADAIYLGGSRFNARASAANFDDESLAAAVRQAHLFGKKVYVTVNILMGQNELNEGLDYLAFLDDIGVDAVIIQDLGLLRLAHQYFPDLTLHGSTQMTVYNHWGAAFLRAAGAERVVLAREVSLAEAAEIRRRSGLDIEIFVHGALCFSYSGQCLMSSMIGGRSGNRGRCAQPCRLEYGLEYGDGVEGGGGGNHLLSPSDLNTLQILPQLVAAGVSALKIEGRMKRPEYVATVVRIYRAALDRYYADPRHFRALPEELSDLEQIFNRGFTTGYYLGRPGLAMMCHQNPKNKGVLLGRIRGRGNKGRYQIELERDLRVGDGVAVWLAHGDQAGTEIGAIWNGDGQLKCAPAGAMVEIDLPGNPPAGAPVFKTSDRILLNKAQESFAPGSKLLTIPLTLEFSACIGQPGHLTLSDDQGNLVGVDGDFNAEKAIKHPLTAGRAREQLTRLGGTAYYAQDFRALIEGDLMIPVSELNSLRRKGIAALEAARLHKWVLEGRIRAPRERQPYACEWHTPRTPRAPHTPCRPSSTSGGRALSLSVSVADYAGLEAALEGGATRVYFGGESYRPVGEWSLEAISQGIQAAKNHGAEAVVSLPRIVAQREVDAGEQKIRAIIDFNPDGFLIRNVGQAHLLRSLWEGRLYGDYTLNVFNTHTAEALEGFSVITLSPELTLAQIRRVMVEASAAELAAAEWEIPVQGAIQLMVSEHCPLGAKMGGGAGQRASGCSMPCVKCKGSAGLRDRLGLIFPIRMDTQCRMHLFNSMDLNLAADLVALTKLDLSVRIEGLAHGADYIAKATSIYHELLFGASSQQDRNSSGTLIDELEHLSVQGTTKGHLYRGV